VQEVGLLAVAPQSCVVCAHTRQGELKGALRADITWTRQRAGMRAPASIRPVAARRSPPSHSFDILASPPSPVSQSQPPSCDPQEHLPRKSCATILPLFGPTAAAVNLQGA